MRVVVVGGGIGGFAAAAELERVGIEWILLERSSVAGEVGAGLQISSNATKVLARLGLERELAAVGVRARANRMVDLTTGELIAVAPLGTEAAQAYGGTFYQVHRADLLTLLTEAVPARRVRTGAEVVGISRSGGGVRVRLADGSVESGDVAVGADGIHSFVARELHGDEEPEFSGVVAWRALIPREKVADLDIEENSNGFIGRGRSVVMYWIRAGELLNVVALMPSAEVRRESWTVLGDTDDLRAGFAHACPLVTTVLDRIEGDSFITGVYSRRPRPWWTDGRITLLGDAAHPMQPYLAQGAGQALEDAAALADALQAGRDDPAAALRNYQDRRRLRATKVQVIAAASALVWNETDPVQIRARNGRFAGLAQLDPLARTLWGWLYQHDPTAPADQVRGLETAGQTVRRHRPVAQQAFEMWRSALTPEHHAGGWRGCGAATTSSSPGRSRWSRASASRRSTRPAFAVCG